MSDFITKIIDSYKLPSNEFGMNKPPIVMSNAYQLYQTDLSYGRFGNLNSYLLGKQIMSMYNMTHKHTHTHVDEDGNTYTHSHEHNEKNLENIDRYYLPNNEDAYYIYLASSGNAPLSAFLTSELHQKGSLNVVMETNSYLELKELITVFDFAINVSFIDTTNTEVLNDYLEDNDIDYLITDVMSMFDYEDIHIKQIAEVCHKHNVKLMVDDTHYSAYYCNPFEEGADIVFASLGKYMNGFADAFGGYIISKKDIAQEAAVLGFGINPVFCWLIQRDLVTFPLRLDRITKTAMKVADYLKTKTDTIVYAKKGGLIVFGHSSFVTEPDVVSFLQKLKVIKSENSYGNCFTTVDTYFNDTLNEKFNYTVRLSIGLEDADTIISDIEQALSGDTNE